ncbi:bifunctional metallophosphatase/5'-nucleotidase [Mesobacillus maritimus]|uniref:bifunctional metallophosphatase/5'-nucleotidase n=1 Tax=Mesobacillus maritimus TaxID=1643336 RepID=UPI00203A431E|nr:bifunctional UDP-sugar hydrolase/5'-nucleotidase [Mesobacillus maritimus]MCM3670266.1 bifunctional metallophosphatase/5'-nucleotidase [Mesobacillus maritimus]
MEVLHIYHTNDLHSHFEHWPRIHQLVTERRKWHEKEGDQVLLFDIGDHMDRWHPLSDATRGKGNCDLLNAAGYDAVTFGNNEGITLSYDDLDQMYENRKFKVLVANLYRKDGTRPKWAQPTEIYTTNKGLRIGVIGLTVNFAHFYDLLGWKVTDPFEELQYCLNDLDGKTDVNILLSHLGIHDDERIGERFPEIDLVLGAHTHHILHEGKIVGETLLGAAGKFGQFTGHVVIEVDENKKQVISKKAVLYDMNNWDPVDKEDEMIERLYASGKSLLEEPVANLPKPIESKHFEESPLASLLCKTLKEWCEADCAFLNAGLLLNGLDKGIVTNYDLLSICPHPINPCTVQLTGAELKEVLLQTKDEKWPHLQVKGLGFRGTVMGNFVYEGVTFNSDSNRDIYISDKPLDNKKLYTVAIPDMFTFGRFFPEIFRSETKKYFLPEFLRDLLRKKLSELQ